MKASPPTTVKSPGEETRKVESPVRSTARPTTARAAPPKVVKRQEADEAAAAFESQERLTSGKPVVKIISESEKSRDTQEDSLFVVEKADPELDRLNVFDRIDANGEDISLSSGDHHDVKGSLIKQLQETKDHLEGDGTTPATARPSSSSTDFLKTQEVEKLRQSLQSMSRSANPLGRTLDALQEDMDSMLTELKMWEEEYRQNTLKVEQERSSIDSEVEELKKRLQDLESEVEEENDKIGMSKALIERQEEKLRRVITLVVQKGPSKSGVRTLHR